MAINFPSNPQNGQTHTHNGKTWTYNGNNWRVAGGGGSGGLSSSISVSDTPPNTVSGGDLWWNSDEGVLKVYYNDGNSSQWVDASMAGSGGSGGSSSSITNGTKTLSIDTNNNISIDTHIIPDTNADYDLGSAEYKIRHLFLSDNSIRFGKDGTGDISGEYVSFGKDNLDRNVEVYTDLDGVVPPTPMSAGKKGDIRIIADQMYVCINTAENDNVTNNWIRTQILTTW